MRDEYGRSGVKQRMVDEFDYAAQSWPHERRVITRLEWGEQGCNPRFVVNTLGAQPQALYDGLYSGRGKAENRIKWAQVGLFATRTSCRVLRSNQLRMLLAASGYVLIERLRERPYRAQSWPRHRWTRCASSCSRWPLSSPATRGASVCTWLRIGPVQRSLRTPCANCARPERQNSAWPAR